MALANQYRSRGRLQRFVRRLLHVDARIVGKFGSLEIGFDDDLCNLKINDNTTYFHRSGADTASIAMPDACPSESLIHSVFKCMSLFEIFRRAHFFDIVFNQENL